jgi:hypothetical protein
MEALQQAEGFCYKYLIKLINSTLPELVLDYDDFQILNEVIKVNSITIKENNSNKKCNIFIKEYDVNDVNGITIFNDENEPEGYRGRILIALNSLIGMIQLVYVELKKKYPDLIEYQELIMDEKLVISLDVDIQYKLVAFIELIN